jgi:hypothetical protein
VAYCDFGFVQSGDACHDLGNFGVPPCFGSISSTIGDLEHNTGISADEARAVLPIKSAVVWDDTVYHSFDTVEIRGRGGGLRFWVSTSSPSGANCPTQAQKSEAGEYLRAVRDLLWT